MPYLTKFVSPDAAKRQEGLPLDTPNVPASEQNEPPQPGPYRELALTALPVLLAMAAPLGREGTHPLSFLVFRSILMALAVLGLVRLVSKGQKTGVRRPFAVVLVAFLALSLVSLRVLDGSSFDGLYWWYNDALFLAGLLGLSVLARDWTPPNRSLVLASIVVSGIIYLLVAILLGQRPVLATFLNPNYFASYLVVGFAICIAAGMRLSNGMLKAGAVVTAAFLFWGMTLAWSRGATVAAASVLLVAAIRYRRWSPLKLAAVGLAVAVVFLGALSSSDLLRKFSDLGSFDPYNYTRPQIWRSSLQMTADHPLLGVGRGQYHHEAKRYNFPVDGAVARYLKRSPIAHNHYLHYIVETGIPAGLLLIAALTWIAITTSRTLPGDPPVFREAGFLTIVGLGTHALVDNNWTIPVVAAGVAVIGVARGIPEGPAWTPWNWSRRGMIGAGLLVAVVAFHSTLIPFAGLLFNHMATDAFRQRDLDRALILNRMATAVVPDQPTFLDNTGSVYLERAAQSLKKRDLEMAIDYFERAHIANPRADEPLRHLEAAHIRTLTGDRHRDAPIHAKIIDVDRRYLAIDPGNPFIRRNLSEALYQTGDVEAAFVELRRTIELEPNFVPGRLQLSRWLAEAGHVAESAQARDEALEVVRRFQDYSTSEPYELLLLGRPLPGGTAGQVTP